MENVVNINKDVSVAAYYFRNVGERLRCFPKKIEWDGGQAKFTETGLRHPTKKGQRMVHVFDMTDGKADYRLEFDAQALTWTLIAISDMHYQAGSTSLAAA